MEYQERLLVGTPTTELPWVDLLTLCAPSPPKFFQVGVVYGEFPYSIDVNICKTQFFLLKNHFSLLPNIRGYFMPFFPCRQETTRKYTKQVKILGSLWVKFTERINNFFLIWIKWSAGFRTIPWWKWWLLGQWMWNKKKLARECLCIILLANLKSSLACQLSLLNCFV